MSHPECVKAVAPLTVVQFGGVGGFNVGKKLEGEGTRRGERRRGWEGRVVYSPACASSSAMTLSNTIEMTCWTMADAVLLVVLSLEKCNRKHTTIACNEDKNGKKINHFRKFEVSKVICVNEILLNNLHIL